jgi:colanic acid biosynthesis glycosyl transferase WcaI
MRVLVISQYFWPESFKINDLVGELVRRGHHVTILTGLPNYPSGEVFPEFVTYPDRYARYEGAEVIRVPIMPRGNGGFCLLLNYLTFAASASFVGPWELRGRQFDVIFAYEPSPITVGLPAVVLRYFKRAPMIFWVQDLWPETLKAVGVTNSKAVLWAVGKLVAFIYKRCDLILAQSKSFIPQISRYAPQTVRVLYFPNWSDAVGVSTSLEEVPAKPGSFNVMFAGNIGDAQDFPAILAAAERLKLHPEVRWLIAGDGRLANWVADEVKRRQLQEHVLMLGRFPSERMSSVFKHADALLVSLKDEPIFGMTIPSKLQTYLATGIPIIAMLNGEGAEVVRDADAGLTCDAGDSIGLAQAVIALASMSVEQRQQLGRNGRVYAQREFGRTQLVDKLEGFLQEAIASRKINKPRNYNPTNT